MVAAMKRLAVFVAVLFAAGLIQAQTQPGAKPADANATTVKPADLKPADPKATGKVGAKKDEKKKEEEPKIPGVTIPRANGGFLGLEVAGGNFKLSFYDKKKKPAKVDVSRATAKWPNPRAPGDNRTVLNVSGMALVGAKPVVPPYNFTVYLTLLQGEGAEAKAVESYVVAFHN
jgi:hypothetical protein